MRKLLFFLFVLAQTCSATAQTKADSLIGKWKYMGAMKSNPVYKLDEKQYHESKPSLKFEFIEFKKDGSFIYNEKGAKGMTAKFLVKGDVLTIGGIEYKIKLVTAKDLTLYRGFYIYKENGKVVHVDDEQLSFQKVKQ